MLFFLPSMIFWTADVSKEAIMMLSLGLTAYGAAKVLARRRGGFMLLCPAWPSAILIRPNELLLVLGGFAVAMMVRPPRSGRTWVGSDGWSAWCSWGLLVIAVYLTFHYLHGGPGDAVAAADRREQHGCRHRVRQQQHPLFVQSGHLLAGHLRDPVRSAALQRPRDQPAGRGRSRTP